MSDADYSKNCHYLHKDDHFVAAFSLCQAKSVVNIKYLYLPDKNR